MSASGRSAVFLDRDGTLIVEKKYLREPAGVSLEAEAVDGLIRLRDAGHPLFVLSNQSGVGRGMFTECDVHRVNDRIADVLAAAGISIVGWYICPHLPGAGCLCRKPLPGMALEASREWRVDLKGSFVVGDKQSDLELADAIEGTGILVTTGQGLGAVPWARLHGRPVFSGLRGAADYIVSRDGMSP